LAASLRLIPKGITANDPFDYAKFWTDYTRLGKEINPETQICFLKMFQTILEGLPAEERLSVLYALTATRNALVSVLGDASWALCYLVNTVFQPEL